MWLAGFALVLLPGLLVVRAPWTAIAPLSLAFWTVSAWWPPFAGPGRSRALAATLLASLLLALLRLVPKHEVEPPPGWRPPPLPPRDALPGLRPPPLRAGPSRLVLAVALALLLPVPLWHNAPGPRLAFQTTSARLFVWYDGVPTSGEPLVPLEPLGAHAPAIATLIADLSQWNSVDPGLAAPRVVATAAALLLVGLFSLCATWAPPEAAALGALAALAVPPWPGFLSLWGDGEALFALLFLLPAAALIVGHASRSSAVAAALLLAAGALAQPALAAVVALLSLAGALHRSAQPRSAATRFAGVLGLALVFAAPGLLPLARALSLREAAAALRSTRVSDLLWFTSFLLLAGLAPLASRRLGLGRSARARAARTGLALAAALLLVLRVHGWFAAGQLPPEARAALTLAALRVPPLTPICAADGVRDFVPALAGRPAGEPGVWLPVEYSEEWARRERRPCGVRLENSMLQR